MKHPFRFALPSRGSGAQLPMLLTLLLALLAGAQLLVADDIALPAADTVGAVETRPAGIDLPMVSVPGAIAARSMFAPGAAYEAVSGADDPLGGVMIAGMVRIGSRVYAVAQAPGGGIRRVPIGGEIAGWRLAALTDTGARLVRGGSARLAVSFGTHPPRAQTPPPSPEDEQ